MNIIKQGKLLISNEEVKEVSEDIFEDTIKAILGDPFSVGKILFTIMKFPFFFREQIFWPKMKAFLNGVYTNDDDDKAKLRAKLNENGEERDNACRLIECIDRAETQQKIRYLINATRCLLVEFIDLQTFFRICHVIKNTLEEDLQFLRKNILSESDHEYNPCTQGLLTAGLMYQSVIDANGNQRYSFTPTAELVDKFAVSYDDVNRYPNPTKNFSKDSSLPISIDDGSGSISDQEIKQMLDETFGEK